MEEDMTNKTPVISVKQWVINLAITCIPVVNIVFLILWAFGEKDTNPVKRNWARAYLLLMVAGFVLAMVVYILIAVIGIFALKSGGGL